MTCHVSVSHKLNKNKQNRILPFRGECIASIESLVHASMLTQNLPQNKNEHRSNWNVQRLNFVNLYQLGQIPRVKTYSLILKLARKTYLLVKDKSKIKACRDTIDCCWMLFLFMNGIVNTSFFEVSEIVDWSSLSCIIINRTALMVDTCKILEKTFYSWTVWVAMWCFHYPEIGDLKTTRQTWRTCDLKAEQFSLIKRSAEHCSVIACTEKRILMQIYASISISGTGYSFNSSV